MQNGADNHRVNLPQAIPVYIVYFTTYVADGQLHFGNDLYKRDDQLVRALANGAQPSAKDTAAASALRTTADRLLPP
jgi:murein L,D-transpeptidase YcbB/YkuD